jgi:hypothetical protein
MRKLLNLARAATEAEFVNIDLVNYFSYLREDLGLAKLLLMLESVVKMKTESDQIHEAYVKRHQDDP